MVPVWIRLRPQMTQLEVADQGSSAMLPTAGNTELVEILLRTKSAL